MPPDSVRRIALAAAVLGGAGALAAEVVFTRKLALLFGVTSPAVATVVAVYMAGMALGAGLGGRIADRLAARAGRLYVRAELFAVGWALTFPLLFALADGWIGTIPAEWSLVACALATAVLVGPAAVASGATFPALTRLVGEAGEIRRLYATNALGAALGALAAGLWLPPIVGYRGTLAVAAACSGVAALLMLRAGRAPAEPEVRAPSGEAISLPLAVAAYAAIGGIGMGAEIGWTRLLEQTGPNPGALTFPVVLAAYLVGLAGGGLWLEPRLRRLGDRRGLGVAILITGGSTALAVLLLPLIPEERLLGHLVGPGPGMSTIFALTGLQVSADRLAIYLLAAALPGMAAGAGFPIAASALAASSRGLGRAVGLTATAGIGAAVVASLWMGFLPSFGPGTVRLLASLGIVGLLIGALLLRRRAAFALPALATTALLVPPWAGLQIPKDEELIGFVETAAGPSAVAREPDGRVNVYTHGERVGGLELALEVPLALHPAPSDVLVIAFGTGMNVKSLLKDPAVERLICVDIDPALPALAESIPVVGGGLFDGTRSRFVGDDGRHHLRSTEDRYDIVYSDVATYAQYVELGTLEFFELVRSRLAPGGMFALKIHADTLTEPGFHRVLATFLAAFPDAALFDNPATPVLVGFTRRPTVEDLEAREASGASIYGKDIARRVPQRTLAGSSALHALASGPVLTDDRPIALRHALVGPTVEGYGDRTAIATIQALARASGAKAPAEVFGVRVPGPRRVHLQPMYLPYRAPWLAILTGPPAAPTGGPPGPAGRPPGRSADPAGGPQR